MFKYSGILAALFISLWSCPAISANHEVNLTVAYKTVNFTGKTAKAIAVNNQIPGPTLHFKEGDTVTLNVINQLDKGTAMHWHGLLVPWQMDGVEHITQAPIPPGGVFHYKFKLNQYGTYWYHAHSDLQEQQGDYGALIIDPKETLPTYNKDYVVVLSDWSNTDPDQIYANLKKEGDYYSTEFDQQATLANFLKNYKTDKNLFDNYMMMEKMRMSIYDYTDVKYDTYLLNGQPINKTHLWPVPAKIGDTVRLRFIGAGAATIFKVNISDNSPMKLIAVDGNNIKPYFTNSLTIGPGETYDVVINIKKNPVFINSELAIPTNIMAGMNMSNMDMSGMDMSHMDNMDMPIESKYKNLVSPVITNNPNKPIYKTLKMDLTGYMGRYMWFINGVPDHEAGPILIEPNKRYRFIFTNSSMMHHPMHIHGHWFIVRNGHGKYDPKLHTLDIAPGEKLVVDMDAHASGQWFFHCHLLYHMMSGMSRVFQYSTMENRSAHPMAHPSRLFQASFIDLGQDVFNNLQKITFKSYWGSDYNKLELYSEDAEIEKGVLQSGDIDIFYWRLLSEFWAIKGGANYFYRPAERGYWQPGIGLEGLMPFYINTDIRAYYHDGSSKLDIQLSRDSQITNKFFIRTGIRSILATRTVPEDGVNGGLNQMRYIIRPYYQFRPDLAVFTEFEHQSNFGVVSDLLGSSENTLTVGVALLL